MFSTGDTVVRGPVLMLLCGLGEAQSSSQVKSKNKEWDNQY